MLVIGVIALVVLGPERLPVVARQPANGSERPSALSPR
ncbi:MAG: twin-arginine translocase TatA/TatE family subunit [Sutterella wadsworthensis]